MKYNIITITFLVLSFLAINCCSSKGIDKDTDHTTCPTIDVFSISNASLYAIVSEIATLSCNLHIHRMYMLCLEEKDSILWMRIDEIRNNHDVIKEVYKGSKEVKGCLMYNSFCFFIKSRMKKHDCTDFFSKSCIRAELIPYDVVDANRTFFDDDCLVFIPDSTRIYNLNIDKFERYAILPGEAIP